VGHVFQGHYTAILVDKENYLLELTRYIVLKPVRPKMVLSAQDWTWSSYCAVIGSVAPPDFLNKKRVSSCFSANPKKAVRRYKEFVEARAETVSPWNELRNQIFLGNDEFVEQGLKLRDSNSDLPEVSRIQKRKPRLPLIHYAENGASRNEAITEAYRSVGYTWKEKSLSA